MIATEAWRRGEFTTWESSEVERLKSEVEHTCWAEQDQHWRSFQTARAVAHAAYARALVASGHAKGAVVALRTALAAQPAFSGAHLQIAETYLAFQEVLGKDWAGRAECELSLALRIANNCKQIQSTLAALYASAAFEKVREAERIYRKIGELPSLSLWFGQFVLNTKAKEYPALFTVHQYLSASVGVSPASRKRLDRLVAGLRSRNAEVNSWTYDSLEFVEVVQLVLNEIEMAGIPLPPELLRTAKGQVCSARGSQAATA